MENKAIKERYYFDRSYDVSVRSKLLSYALEDGRVEVEHNSPLIPDVTYHPRLFTLKRFTDIFISLLSIIILGLFLPLVALGIKLSSKGPVIFKQQRTGLYGIPFTCLKFRTMHVCESCNENGKPDVTKKRDPRIFWFGSFLRKANLDELPQLYNVLKGEMSIVGPRPYPVEECIYWNNIFPDFYHRYRAKPGLTGLAQVQGYRGGTHDVERMRIRLDCDLKYVRNQSQLMDLKIIIKTALQMVHLRTNAH